MKLSTVLLVASAICAGPAYAQDTIFGFTFNEPVEAPECPFRSIGGKKYHEVKSDFTCFWPVETKAGDPAPSRTVVISNSNAPRYMKGLFKAYIQDEKLVGVRFFTFGVHSQEQTLSQLIQKYGEPLSATKRRVQTAAGATFEAVSAQWRTETVAVNFEGVIDRIDLGEVTVDTREFFTRRLHEVQKKGSTEVKL